MIFLTNLIYKITLLTFASIIIENKVIYQQNCIFVTNNYFCNKYLLGSEGWVTKIFHKIIKFDISFSQRFWSEHFLATESRERLSGRHMHFGRNPDSLLFFLQKKKR